MKPSVLIVGAGFGGLALALELTRHGHDNFTILEKGADVGGVWRENTYPGAACDVPSVLYSFSFEPNPHWPSRFSSQAAILDYMRGVAAKHGLYEHIEFGVEISSAEFDADRGVWRVLSTDGRSYEADVFVPALGQLSRPVLPNIPGRDDFAGAAFHSAQWDHSVDLTGKRVAVIGSGASAIQVIPSIQPDVAHLTVFQRSAPYIIPKADTQFSPLHHWVFRTLPLVQQAERLAWWTFFEAVSMGISGNAVITEVMSRWTQWHRNRQVSDPDLRAKLTPDYPAGCKRGLMASNYYPALTQPNVDVVVDGIAEITAEGVRTDDGVLHEVDVIVFCTGFAATEFLAPVRIAGLGGKDLHEFWSGGAHAYLGIAVPNFPNLFLMYGPNTNVGSGSIIYMQEAEARYIRQAVEHLATLPAGSYVEVSDEVETAFDSEIQSRLTRTVWAGCTSWYRDASGRVSTNWPGRTREYANRTRRFVAAAYETVTGS
jgi:cation diffusion facilitator CzcD-associated flavoprotein CzcO